MGSLLKDSMFLVMTQVLGAVLGYVFYIFIARRLGPAEFGIFGALISIFYIMAAFQITLQITAAKYVSHFLAKKDNERLKRFNYRTITKIALFSFIFVVVLAVMVPLFSSVLKIEPIYLLMSFLIMPFMFLSSATRGIFQGFQDFKNLSINLSIEPVVKLIVSVILVLLGFGLFGALVGIILSFLVPFALSFFQLEHVIKRTDTKVGKKEVYKYILPVLITLTVFVLAVNIDSLIVKAMFSNEETGYYAVASFFAKLLFYMSLAVGMAMFPRVSELHALKKPHKDVLKQTLKYILLGCFSVLGVFALFSKQIVIFFYGIEYLPSFEYILILLTAQTIFSVAMTLALYNISQDKVKHLSFYGVLIILELIIISQFVYSPLGIAWAVFGSSIIFLVYSVISIFDLDIFV